jgi:hypothetical protein
MPEWILPATFVSVLAEMRPCFTGPSFDSFRVLIAGWVHALGKHRVSDVIRASGALATKHYSAYYRLLSRAHWSLDALGLQPFGVVLQWLGIDEVELVLGDTLCARRPLERTFQDAKDKLGIEDPQVQRPEAVRRATPMGLLVYSYVVLWYLRDAHRQARRMHRHRDPWAQPDVRPSFADMLATLRRLGWAQAFVDPASLDAARSKVLATYLQRVVAAA